MNVRAVSCPVCAAAPGHPCHRPTGRLMPLVHLKRKAAAARAVRSALDPHPDTNKETT